MNRYLVILVLILGIYYSAFITVYPQVIRSSRIGSSVSELRDGKWKVSLSPKDRWFDTKVNVVRGATINIFATGFVTWAPPGGRNMSSTVGPNGTRPPFVEDKSRFPMPDAGCGSLIMKVGNSIYSVGEGGSIDISESGTIQLMVNDDALSDNSGGFSVDIEIPQSRNQNKSNHLVFSSQRDGNQEVYLLDLAKELATNLSQSSDDDGYPRCSPDGRRIAFATNRDGYWEIYLMNQDGSGQQNLTKDRGGNGYMDWSPDGRTLVFASTRNGAKNNELYTIRTDGRTGLRRLTDHPAEDVHPVWSPDGRKIAFASERDGNRQIYVMNADGTNLTRLMSNRWYDDYPAWSPDGSQIAFSSDRDSRTSERLDIYVANSYGSNIKRITSHPADDRHPSWSPDGSLLTFASDRDGDRDIFVVRVDGTGLKKVFSSAGNDEHPQWCGNAESEDRISTPTISRPNCVVSYTSGSCWTIKPTTEKCSILNSLRPSVTISPDGLSCTVVVPATVAQGVKATTSAGKQFFIRQGDKFEIRADGLVSFSSNHSCVSPEGMFGWYDPGVDSPFKQNVGGLEFSIGGLEANRFFAGKYFLGTAQNSGVPVFRVIERLSGYGDGNSGGFTVTIRKVK